MTDQPASGQAGGGAAAAAPTYLTQSIVTAKTWHAVAAWSYETRYEMCSICKQNLNDLCLDCQSQLAQGQSRCSICFGSCGHVFHQHCCSAWLRNHTTCPICCSAWETERVADSSA